MAERDTEKPRTCTKCGVIYATTALQIKDHAASCAGRNQ